MFDAYIFPLTRSPQSQSTTIATRRPRLVRTESQKKRSAAKAAETRARNKAAKATHNSNSMDAVRPDDASESAINPPPPGPQIPQVPPGSILSGNVDDGFGAYILSVSNTHICSNGVI